ncbi:MAG: helix-turn-helix domain-containing protein [Actinomycetota bacterium]
MRWGMSVGEAGWRLGITRREYIALEDGERPPTSTEYERICELYGWPDVGRLLTGC